MPPPAVPLVAGDVVGNYVIRGALGEGGMGAVYHADHLHMERRAVIKVLQPSTASSPEAIQRFVNEARAAGSLSHRNIVNVYDNGQRPDGHWYLAMEYVEGTSLDRWRTFRGGVVNADEVVSIIGQAANGLHAAHERGIVHRDVKPGNVLISDDGHVRVIDFGIAKISAARGGSGTAADVILGTPAYMAPEQIRGDEIDRRIDVYALGVIAWELLTGQALWGTGGEMPGKILEYQLRESRPLDPCAINPRIPPTIGAAVARALAFDREERYATTAEFVIALGHGLPSEWGDSGIQILRRVAPELLLVGPAISTAGREVAPRHVVAPTLRVHAPALPQVPVATGPQSQAVRGELPTAITQHEAPSVPTLELPIAASTAPAAMVPRESRTGIEHRDENGSLAAHAVSTVPTGARRVPSTSRARVAVVSAGVALAGGVAIFVAMSSGGRTSGQGGPAGQQGGPSLTAPNSPAAPATSALAIVTDPPGGLVFVDGIARGSAPVNFAATVGSDLEIRAELAGHDSTLQRVQVGAAPSTVRLTLTPTPAAVIAPPTSTPSPAKRASPPRSRPPASSSTAPFDPSDPVP